MAHSYRALAHRHPKLFPLIAVHRLNTPTGVARHRARCCALVHAAVADERLAAQYFRVLGYYMTGAALDETAGYAKGPSAAEPVSDAYIAENCPLLAAAARYFTSRSGGTARSSSASKACSGRCARGSPQSTATDAPALALPKPVIRPKR